jgi:hypothetical protein
MAWRRLRAIALNHTTSKFYRSGVLRGGNYSDSYFEATLVDLFSE